MLFYNWRNVDRTKSGAAQYEYKFFKFSLRFDLPCFGSAEAKTQFVLKLVE